MKNEKLLNPIAWKYKIIYHVVFITYTCRTYRKILSKTQYNCVFGLYSSFVRWLKLVFLLVALNLCYLFSKIIELSRIFHCQSIKIRNALFVLIEANAPPVITKVKIIYLFQNNGVNDDSVVKIVEIFSFFYICNDKQLASVFHG